MKNIVEETPSENLKRYLLLTPVKNVADNLWDHMQVQHWDSRRIWPVSPTLVLFTTPSHEFVSREFH